MNVFKQVPLKIFPSHMLWEISPEMTAYSLLEHGLTSVSSVLLPILLSTVIPLDFCNLSLTCQLNASAYEKDTFLWSICVLPNITGNLFKQ